MTNRAHEHRLRVRYAETDQMGVVHHANYLVYVEEGRTRMMAARGCSYAEFERNGWGLPVRKAELRYRTVARYEDELVIRTNVDRVGPASVRFATQIALATDGTVVAEALVELACVRLDDPARKPVALPSSLRERLAE
ncbi:MAG: acyl-CoA thioesterase [Planctomycetota bacterium]